LRGKETENGEAGRPGGPREQRKVRDWKIKKSVSDGGGRTDGGEQRGWGGLRQRRGEMRSEGIGA